MPDDAPYIPGGIIRWEEPPPFVPKGRPRRDGQRPWAIVIYQLKQHPGVWALLDEQAGAHLVPRINSGGGLFTPRGAFEATQRTIDGNISVWAVYLGDPQ